MSVSSYNTTQPVYVSMYVHGDVYILKLKRETLKRAFSHECSFDLLDQYLVMLEWLRSKNVSMDMVHSLIRCSLKFS